MNTTAIGVFLMIKGEHKDLIQELGEKTARLVFDLWRRPVTQILCELTPAQSPRDGECLFEACHSIDLAATPDIRFWFEFELRETFDKRTNLASVVTNREGKRLATAFHGRGRRFVNNKPVPTGFARFRTTKSDLVLVEVGKYSGDGKVRAYRLVTEGLRCFLVEQNLGVFHVAGSTVYHNEDIYNFKWTSDSFSGEKQKEIQAAFAPVVQAVVTKTDHNCFQNCCEPHYAMTVEEEREFRKQMADNRRAKQKNPKTNVTPTSTKPEEPTEIVPTEIVPPPVSEPSTAEVSDNDNGKGKGKKPKGATKRSKKGDNGTAKKTDGNVVTTPVDEPTSVAAG